MPMQEVFPGGTRRAAGPAGSDVVAMPKTVLIVEDNELNMKLFNDLARSAWLRDHADPERRRGARTARASTGPT